MHFDLHVVRPPPNSASWNNRLSRQKVDSVLEERADLILIELPVLEIHVHEIKQAVL